MNVLVPSLRLFVSRLWKALFLHLKNVEKWGHEALQYLSWVGDPRWNAHLPTLSRHCWNLQVQERARADQIWEILKTIVRWAFYEGDLVGEDVDTGDLICHDQEAYNWLHVRGYHLNAILQY